MKMEVISLNFTPKKLIAPLLCLFFDSQNGPKDAFS